MLGDCWLVVEILSVMLLDCHSRHPVLPGHDARIVCVWISLFEPSPDCQYGVWNYWNILGWLRRSPWDREKGLPACRNSDWSSIVCRGLLQAYCPFCIMMGWNDKRRWSAREIIWVECHNVWRLSGGRKQHDVVQFDLNTKGQVQVCLR